MPLKNKEGKLIYFLYINWAIYIYIYICIYIYTGSLEKMAEYLAMAERLGCNARSSYTKDSIYVTWDFFA